MSERKRGRPPHSLSNRGRVRQVLRDEGPATVVELAQRLDLPQGRLAAVISNMKSRGEVIASFYKRYDRDQRPRKIYQLAPTLAGDVVNRYDPTMAERVFLLERRVALLESQRDTTSAPRGARE